MTCYGNKYGELLKITVQLRVHNLLVNLERLLQKKKIPKCALLFSDA